VYLVYGVLRRPAPLLFFRRFRFRFNRHYSVVQPPQRQVYRFRYTYAEPFGNRFEEVPFADGGDALSIGADTEMGVDDAPEFPVPVASPMRWSSWMSCKSAAWSV
jgi:hypothetical protein